MAGGQIQWIRDLFDGQKVLFPDKTIWTLENKLSEASRQINPTIEASQQPCPEARAVYVCKQISGPQVGSQAIIKVHMQIPSDEMLHPNPRERAKYVSEELSDFTENEIDVLARLTECDCSIAPRLISWTRQQQDETMWVPGGYVVYVLMEKVPGAPLSNFWVEKDFSLRDRDEIRKSFKAALSEILKCGIIPMDTGVRNILWDEASRKCYIIDFEDCLWDGEAKWQDCQYFLWGLAETMGRGRERW